jgi:hypothetical protein
MHAGDKVRVNSCNVRVNDTPMSSNHRVCGTDNELVKFKLDFDYKAITDYTKHSTQNATDEPLTDK